MFIVGIILILLGELGDIIKIHTTERIDYGNNVPSYLKKGGFLNPYEEDKKK